MNLKNNLKKIPYLSFLSRIAQKKKINVWLVGGVLRDAYLTGEDVRFKEKREKTLDFDFCVEKNVKPLIKEFSKQISSKFIILDEKQQSYRTILKKGGKFYTYDFTLMRGKDLRSDLLLRDFSINTLALNLNKKEKTIIDLFDARKDFKKKIIRILKEQVLSDDPLRILRGFTFSLRYGFNIESKTQKAMAKFKRFLKDASGERLSEELFKVFLSDFSYKAIKQMDKLKILDEAIPYITECRGVFQGAYHHLGVWQHSLETLREFESLYKNKLMKNKDILAYLNDEIGQGRSRAQLLKLACLLHDIGKPLAKKKIDKKTIFHTHEKIGRDMVEKVSLRLRLSFREKEILKKLVYWHLRPGYLADQIKPSKRAIYRFFHDTGNDGVAVIILSLSDWRATRGPLTNAKKRRKHEIIMLNLIDNYFESKKQKPLPKIVNGYDIMRKLSLSPSPCIGKILKKVKEEQALGKISTKKDAYALARKMISKDRQKKAKKK